MKLRQIESGIHGSRFFNRPALHTQHLYNPNAGSDSGTRTSGGTEQPSGIPHKKRHRQYFGIREDKSREPLVVSDVAIPLMVERSKDVLDHKPIYRVYLKNSPEERVGYAKLSSDGQSIMDVVISPAWQRKGIATALYDFIERDLQLKLRPSTMYQTPDGKAFWAARAPHVSLRTAERQAKETQDAAPSGPW